MSGKTDQRQKFIDAARENGASEDANTFEKALKRIAKAPPPDTVKDRKDKKPKE